jgi:hypothetical protein
LPFGYTEIRFEVETRSASELDAMCAALEEMGITVIR